MDHRIVHRGRRVALVGLVAVALLVGWPLSPGASAGVRTPSATAVGNTYGGLSSQGVPLFVDLTSTRRKLVRAYLTLELTCTSGSSFTYVDNFVDLPVSRAGKVRIAYGPYTERNDDGTTSDFQGRMSGALNDSRTRLSGVWRLVITDHDAAGAVTDTCDSGLVSWKTKN